MLKHYLVNNKPDDYNNCDTEFVQTTQEFALQYYNVRPVAEEDVEVLKKYYTYVGFEEEKERTEEQRFYGGSEY